MLLVHTVEDCLGRTVLKSVTIMMPVELDKAAADEAERRGMSKSALIRQGLRSELADEYDETSEGASHDPFRDLAGFGSSGVTTAEDEIDRTVYDT